MQIMDDLIRTGLACDHQIDHDVVVDSCRSVMTLPALRDQLVSRNVDFFRDDLLPYRFSMSESGRVASDDCDSIPIVALR
jgi:hypothetical protein